VKVLVAYGTKYGSTAEVAERIARVVRSNNVDVTVRKLGGKPDVPVEGFDLVVVGSAIIAGSWTPEALKFLEVSRGGLAGKSVALFACCGDVVMKRSSFEDCRNKYLVEVASEKGISRPLSLGLFGGVLDFERYGFLVKAILHGAKKSIEAQGVDLSKPYDFRNWEEIDDWAASLLRTDLGKMEQIMRQEAPSIQARVMTE
jgi:menaquinone-dependent protoporphyrinogen oxidase